MRIAINFLFAAAATSALCLHPVVVDGFALSNRYAVRKPSSSLLRMADDAAADDTKVCLVTGSSRGIGRCIANELVKKGEGKVKIVINDIPQAEEYANEAVQEIKDMGGDAIAVLADCSKPDSIKEMFAKIESEYGHVDVLVNNAGIARDALMLRMKPEQWQQVIDINLSGVYFVSQAFFKQAVKKKIPARVVNIASVVGQIGNPGQCNYAAAKAGVIGLTKSNAKEFAKKGIKVNAVCPGFIQTAMTANLGDDYLEEISHMVPLGRLGKPEEVAGMVRFLALDEAGEYITGHSFDVDGGIGIGAS